MPPDAKPRNDVPKETNGEQDAWDCDGWALSWLVASAGKKDPHKPKPKTKGGENNLPFQALARLLYGRECRASSRGFATTCYRTTTLRAGGRTIGNLRRTIWTSNQWHDVPLRNLTPKLSGLRGRDV